MHIHSAISCPMTMSRINNRHAKRKCDRDSESKDQKCGAARYYSVAVYEGRTMGAMATESVY